VERVDPLIRRVAGFRPVRYLRRWLQSIERRYGAVALVIILLLLIIVFGLIALWIVGAAWWPTVLTAGGLFLLAAVLVASHFRRLALVPVLLALPAALVVGLLSALEFPYYFYVLGVTVLAIWLASGAMDRWRDRPGLVAWILFAAIAIWSGALVFLRERGADDPSLEIAVVKRNSSPLPLYGFYLGRTSKHVYVASAPECDGEECARVLSIPEANVACLAFGPPRKLSDMGTQESWEAETDLSDFGATVDETNPRGEGCIGSPRGQDPDKPKPEADGIGFFWHLVVWLVWPLLGPTPPTETKVRERLVLDSDLLFRFGESDLTRAGIRKLRAVVHRIRRSPPRPLYVHGHTDGVGRPEDNQRLSEQRAWAVTKELSRHLGVRWPIRAPEGFGERRPIACNKKKDGSDNPIGRAYNRRVEIYTVPPPKPKKPLCGRRAKG
jgi:outer membrane protein OmpA-like peptidoglycan-associated protein